MTATSSSNARLIDQFRTRLRVCRPQARKDCLALLRIHLGPRPPRRGRLFGIELPLPFRRLICEARGVSGVTLAIQQRLVGVPGSRPHFDAVDGTGRQAQLATGAAIGEHRVHEFLRADDGVDGTGRQTAGAADAASFIDPGNLRRRFDAMRRIQGQAGRCRSFANAAIVA